LLNDGSTPPMSSRGRSGEEPTKPQHDRLISDLNRNCNAKASSADNYVGSGALGWIV
jgi:hypothetical protein